ncbi:glycerate kinase [Chromobacterium sp. LK1]|uniref:glycerate kinase n=1 Tax=Chromobacterium sp. LK1 TaxID=1628193 RepID=UPI0006530AC6|nr:glycerate kinase [Chromobacterium sp. LK1]KMN35792.1 glycerate kinase [Chromobacterium sp. LK1]
MKIVIAPDSYKESLSALHVAQAIEDGFREIFPAARYCKLPMADGGEGTVQAMLDALGGQWREALVRGPLGEAVSARYGLTVDGVAVIEMAAASGLALVPTARRNPLLTGSHGTGELIRAALDAGARRFVLGIGGSATNDGGAGMLQALGARLLDADGRELPPGGAALARLARLDLSGLEPRLAGCRIDVACDVDNPLTGPRGASAVFGPQKGATPAMVAELDAALAHFAARLEHEAGVAVTEVAGAGAAGGMGAALLACLGGQLRSGSAIVAEAVGLDASLADADLAVTGEGRIDGQSVQGKTPIGVARVARRYGVPVLAIGGCLGAGSELTHAHGLDAVFAAVSRPCSVEQALAEAGDNVRRAARNAAAALALGMKLSSQNRFTI